ncbi:hypothetical protein F5Y08DRAFT_62875 [Xylaria arbuscula]|nr:hypothetical protein F5Y08DRAFT_62875 [Xylaria arbuscula]
MLDTWQIAGTVGTWVAVLLTFVTLTAIIGPWLLLRQAYNARNRALNAVQDSNQDYVTKGVGFSRSVRFFRKTKVPSLAPNFDSWSHDIPIKIPATNECWTATYPDPTTCRTGWAVFCRLLEAHSTPQQDDSGTKTSSRRPWWHLTPAKPKLPARGTESPVVLPRDGYLIFKHNYTFLPVSRYWILVIGLLGRYAHRADNGKAQMPASLRRDLNEERAYVEQHNVNDIETALSESDTVGFDFAGSSIAQRPFMRWRASAARMRSASVDSRASSISRVTDVSIPPILPGIPMPVTGRLCGITGEFSKVMSEDVPPGTLMFTPHNRYEMGLSLPMTESVSISTLFWLANGFIPVFCGTEKRHISRVVCLEDPAGYSGASYSYREDRRARARRHARQAREEIENRYRTEYEPYQGMTRASDEESEWESEDLHSDGETPDIFEQIDSHHEGENEPINEKSSTDQIGNRGAGGENPDEDDVAQVPDITGWEVVLYTGGTEGQNQLEGSTEPDPDEVRLNRTTVRSSYPIEARERPRSRSRSPMWYGTAPNYIRRARFDETWTRTTRESRSRTRYRSSSPIYFRRSPSRSSSPPPTIRKIKLCRATDCPKSLNLAMEALQIQFTSIDSLTVIDESAGSAGPPSRFDPFDARASEHTSPPDHSSTDDEMESGHEWIALPFVSSDAMEFYMSRVDVQTMMLAMLDIPWDPRGYLIGCRSRTTLWRMYLEQMSVLTEKALGVFKRLPWTQSPAMKKRFEEQSWLHKNPRASQPDRARLVDLDQFLTAIMREKKIQYKAIALGIITDEDARSFARWMLSRYDPDNCFKYADIQLLLDRQTREWSVKPHVKHKKTGVTCKFIPESLIGYRDCEEKEDVVVVEDVVLVTLWACVRAELWLGSLNGDDLMDVVRELKRTVHLI